MLQIGRMLFFSKSSPLMAFKGGLSSRFATSAVAPFVSPCLLQSSHEFNGLSPWYWQQQKISYMKYGSYGSSSPLGLPPMSGISSNCLPPSGSSKPPSSNFPLLLFPLKQPSSSLNVQRRFNYNHTLLRVPFRAKMLGVRGLHSSRTLGKSDSSKDCEPMKDICRTKKDACGDTESCKKKDDECYPEKVKCEPQKAARQEIDDDKPVCPKSCVRGGKCIIAASKKPAKMVYGSTECPPSKLIKPRSCPRTSTVEPEEPICSEKAAAAKKARKEICVPPPLPGPPTDPVPLCPCPPPPKLHPGPCPCSVFKEEIKIKPSASCPVKDKYPCCIPVYYCPPKKPCVRKLPCDQMEEKKNKKS